MEAPNSLNSRNNNDLWARAIQNLDPEDKTTINFSYDKLTVLSDLKTEVEATQQRCKDNRWHLKRKSGEKVILRDLFAKVVKWINLFKQVGDTAVQYDPGHAALPWALVRFILQATVNDVEKYEFVTENIETVSRYICRCKIIERLYLGGAASAVEQLESTLVRLYSAILLCLSNFKRYFDQKDSARFVSSIRDKKVFEGFMHDINEGLEDVHQCATLVGREDECFKYQDLKDIIVEFNNPLNRISTQLQKVEDNLQDSKRKMILDWMSNIEKVPYLKHHKESKRQILEGTGSWLLEDATFKKWQDDSASSLLWLHGIIGSGKSKLTSLVIEDAIKSASDGQIPRPIYFYCSRNSAEPLRSESTAILGSIARQLASLEPTSALFPPAVEKYSEEEAQGGPSSSLDIQDSCDLIAQLISLYPTAVIIIDALDECTGESRVDLLDFIKNTLNDSSCLVKFFISSREDAEIVYQLTDFPNVDISSTKNQADIEAFVENETKKLVKRGTLLRNSQQKEALEKEIIRKISKDAAGMFRWASLQLQNLTLLKTDQDIQAHLGKIPPSLETLYMEIYGGISTNQGTDSKRIARNTFCLLLRLRENLLPSEFIKLVQKSSEDNLNTNTILDICCNLVVLDETVDVFRFAHLSVREFFEKLPEFSPQKSHSIVASTSMRHIDTAKRSEWLKKYARAPIRTVGDYIAIWLLYHFQLAGNPGQENPLLFKEAIVLASRQDLLRFRVDENALFSTRRECWPLVLRNFNPDLLFLFNSSAIGLSEIFKAFIINSRTLPDPSSNYQSSQNQSWIFNEGLMVLTDISANFSLGGFKEALTEDNFVRLALHAISHGNYTVLKFLLTEKLCQVTEGMLLRAVDACNVRKTSGSDWKEPAVLVDFLLDSAVRQNIPGFLTTPQFSSLEREPFSEPVVFSTEIQSVLKDLLTPAVIRKAIIALRVDESCGITCTVMTVLAKWGIKVVLTQSLMDAIAISSLNPAETLGLLLDSHEDLLVPFKTLEPMASGAETFARSHIQRLFLKCPLSDLTQDTIQYIMQKYANLDFAILMMKRNLGLIVNEQVLLSIVVTNKVASFTKKPKRDRFELDSVIGFPNRSSYQNHFETTADFSLTPQTIKALENLEGLARAQFKVAEKVLDAAKSMPRVKPDVLKWLIDRSSGYSNSWGEELIINALRAPTRIEIWLQTREFIILFRTMLKKRIYSLTQPILDICTQNDYLDVFLSWFLINCECCIDKQQTMDRLIEEKNWHTASVLHTWDRSIEIRNDYQKFIEEAIKFYDPNLLGYLEEESGPEFFSQPSYLNFAIGQNKLKSLQKSTGVTCLGGFRVGLLPLRKAKVQYE